jgi:hypothetical protein
VRDSRLIFRRGTGALISLCALLLAGCFESDEDRAVAAYRDHDYDTARALAGQLADASDPRGFELLALMTAQGLGGEMDFGQAFALADRAIGLDASYQPSRATIESFVDATATSAEAAFAAGQFDRARALADPLKAFGHAGGAALVNRLITGGYVTLDGSAMSWRAFWNECSGNTRREAESGGAETFTVRCGDQPAVWDGVVVSRKNETLLVKMDPGRRRAHHDLALVLAVEPEPGLAERGEKIRFSGMIAAAGDASRPDRLSDARVLGPGLLTPEEVAHKAALEREAVVGACRRLINQAIRTSHAPQWTHALRARLPEVEQKRLRFYSFIGIDSPPREFSKLENGGWLMRLTGHATVQAHNDQTASTQDFLVACHVDADHRTKPRGEALGSVTFEELSEPRFNG